MLPCAGGGGVASAVNSLVAEQILKLLGQDGPVNEDAQRHLQFLFLVLDSLHAGIIVIDSASRIVYANQGYARILGVPVAKVLGKRLKDIEPAAPLLRSLEEGRSILDGYIALNSVDKCVVCDQTPVVDAEGKVLGAVATFWDAEADAGADPDAPALPAQTDPTELPIPFRSLVGKNLRFLQTLVLAGRAAGSDATILVLGESGTGKELLARAVHVESARAAGPLVCVNCAAIPENLLESELFGYEDGAFTGARKSGKPGKIELAHGGTLFLDEIGEMSPLMQAKLLRVIQERQVERIGSTHLRSVSVRIIAATHRNLEEMVAAGQFREDLYYRLNVVPLHLPALRERKDDIPSLVSHFLRLLTQSNGQSYTVSAAYMQRLMAHRWPGNVRELRNALEYSVIMAPGSVLEPEHLPQNLQRAGGSATEAADKTPWQQLRERVAALERQTIGEALAAAGGNRSRAIRLLGIGRTTFYKKLAELGLDAG